MALRARNAPCRKQSLTIPRLYAGSLVLCTHPANMKERVGVKWGDTLHGLPIAEAALPVSCHSPAVYALTGPAHPCAYILVWSIRYRIYIIHYDDITG